MVYAMTAKTLNWPMIGEQLTKRDRYAHVVRNTKETQIDAQVWLDREGGSKINTGVGFFDHMLDQIATHGGFRMEINVKGDLYIDNPPHRPKRYRLWRWAKR